MAVTTPTHRPTVASKQRRVARIFARLRRIARHLHPAWYLSLLLLLYIVLTSWLRPAYLPAEPFREFPPPRNQFNHEPPPLLPPPQAHQPVSANATKSNSSAANPNLNSNSSASLLQDADLMRARLAAARKASYTTSLGNHFCVLQPTLSSGKAAWTEGDARSHIALRAFLRTFIATVTPGEQHNFRFSIYYGHDSDDPVLGEPALRAAFEDEARSMLRKGGFDERAVRLVFTPLYGLHSRVNAIWNVLAKDAYYDACDYFFMSNDDMVFFTSGWVSRARDSLNGIGSKPPHKRPCRNLGIVRFKDEWATWATFTFHVSTRIHLEIFGGVYYPVPYNTTHNDYWISMVYRTFDASKYRGEVRVRNRVDDVDFALAHPKDTTKVAPPRYQYDKRGNVRKYVLEGRARVSAWLNRYRGTDRCLPPL